jgi:hypothetical protein
MKVRALLVAAAALVVSAVAAQEKERALLAYRFPALEGKTAVYEAERTVTTVAEGTDDEGKPLPPSRISSTTAQTIAIVFESCLESEARVAVTTRRIRSTIRQDQDEFVYDSEKPPEGEVPPELKQVASLVGQRVVLKITRKGDVVKIEQGARPGARAEDYKGTFLPLPGEPRAPGERWTSKQRAPLGQPPVGELVTTYVYRLAGLEGDATARRARIEAAIETTFEPLRSSAGVGAVVVRDGGGKGHAVVDANGLLVEEETETHMTLVTRADAGARPTQRIEGRSRQKLVSLEDAKMDGGK